MYQTQNEVLTLNSILSQNGNTTCADCGSKYPKFVSVSHLVIICEKCEEIHRLIGFDTRVLHEIEFDSALLKKLKETNNQQQKEYYEMNKPYWFVTPFETDSRIVRSKYIQKKYRDKFFMQHEPTEEKDEEQFYNKILDKIKDIKKQKEREHLMNSDWHYLKAEGDEIKTIGPLTKMSLTSLLTKEVVDESFYVWHPAMKNWQQIIDVEELDFEKRNFKIFKENKDLLSEIPTKSIKFVTRVLYSSWLMTEAYWRRFWVTFKEDAICLHKTPDKKPDISLKLNLSSPEELSLEVKIMELDCSNLIKYKVFVIRFSEFQTYSFTHEDSNEVIEWIHNFKKYALIRSKFEGQLPLYEDNLNPLKPNILDIEKLIETRVKCGILMKEPSGVFETVLQKRWFELTVDCFYYFENQRDDVPKGEIAITASTRVSRSKDFPKYGTKTKCYHFQVETAKNTIVHLWDFTEEGVHSWITAFNEVIAAKKRFQPKTK